MTLMLKIYIYISKNLKKWVLDSHRALSAVNRGTILVGKLLTRSFVPIFFKSIFSKCVSSENVFFKTVFSESVCLLLVQEQLIVRHKANTQLPHHLALEKLLWTSNLC